jgi:hypothetical protein
MKKISIKMVAYTALILVSSLLFSVDVLADTEKKPSPVTTLPIADKNSSAISSKVLAEKRQEVVNEARDSISGTQQALIAVEKNDTKTALSIML